MNLLVIRHARAESVKEFAKTNPNDDMRPLTSDGRDRMRRGAAGLRRIVERIDVLASSPLLRTRQTAEVVAAAFQSPQITELEELRPGSDPAMLLAWLQDAGELETIAVVGHEMQLRKIIGRLLTGTSEPIVRIKKGAAVMLELESRAHSKREKARLLWAVTPRQLRMLGG